MRGIGPIAFTDGLSVACQHEQPRRQRRIAAIAAASLLRRVEQAVARLGIQVARRDLRRVEHMAHPGEGSRQCGLVSVLGQHRRRQHRHARIVAKHTTDLGADARPRPPPARNRLRWFRRSDNGRTGQVSSQYHSAGITPPVGLRIPRNVRSAAPGRPTLIQWRVWCHGVAGQHRVRFGGMRGVWGTAGVGGVEVGVEAEVSSVSRRRVPMLW